MNLARTKLARIIFSSMLLAGGLLSVVQPLLAQAQPPAKPAAPSDLRAVATGSTSVKLTWTDNSSDETGFRIQRATDSGFTANVTAFTVAVNVVTYSDTTVSANTVYYFRVIAFNAVGDSPPSDPAVVSTQLIQINNKYPTVEVTAGEKAVFQVELKYGGDITSEPKIFNLTASGPKDWDLYMTPQYPTDRKISSIQLLPGFQVGETLLINSTPAYWLKPDPGNYTIKLQVSSQDGKITASADLTTKITAKYSLALTPAGEQYSTTATAAKDNIFAIKAINTGSAPVGQINFSADKPTDWQVKFTPEKLDSIASLDTQTIDVNIVPPARTIAGDYLITVKASGTQASAANLEIRVTVETPTIWGWVGIGIVVVVIAGLVFTFRQLSRR